MYVYQINPDGITCAIKFVRAPEAPEGWTQVPPQFKRVKALWWKDDQLTDQRPQSVEDEDAAYFEAENKIQAKMRDMAIKELIKTGDLPADFEDQQ